MKKALFTFLPALFLLWNLSNISFAQLATNSTKYKLSNSIELISASEKSTVKNTDGDYLNNVNTKALRHFTTSYEKATEVRWAKFPSGFRVHFVNDGIDTKIYYNENGSPEATVRYYFEKDMPRNIRHTVKTIYYDFSIFSVTEIAAVHKTAYLVKMEDKTCWKTVKIVDGEMEVTEEYLKS